MIAVKLPWMSRSDRRRWEAAGTLGELGELMALWLEGKVDSRPGYAARFGPDEETVGLVPVLAACNRAGFVTDCSQPGVTGPGFDGRLWSQRAAVEGFVGDKVLLDRIRSAGSRAGLTVIAEMADGRHRGVIVTRAGGEDCTGFGRTMSPRHVRHIFQGCNRQALDALVGAWQVSVVDPVWGRNDVLWPVLSRAVGARVGV
ncbi:DUF6919 domain-containing protein [Streptomyces klenkii]|uniref:DUF6919 domain-containing protein n=1 Tax=Streptomyces klenkii TaxID=1420899 RepID=UPI0036EC218D